MLCLHNLQLPAAIIIFCMCLCTWHGDILETPKHIDLTRLDTSNDSLRKHCLLKQGMRGSHSYIVKQR